MACFFTLHTQSLSITNTISPLPMAWEYFDGCAHIFQLFQSAPKTEGRDNALNKKKYTHRKRVNECEKRHSFFNIFCNPFNPVSNAATINTHTRYKDSWIPCESIACIQCEQHFKYTKESFFVLSIVSERWVRSFGFWCGIFKWQTIMEHRQQHIQLKGVRIHTNTFVRGEIHWKISKSCTCVLIAGAHVIYIKAWMENSEKNVGQQTQ